MGLSALNARRFGITGIATCTPGKGRPATHLQLEPRTGPLPLHRDRSPASSFDIRSCTCDIAHKIASIDTGSYIQNTLLAFAKVPALQL